MTVPRETLYKEVWAEPMTTVAKRYEVSSNYLARICERLNIPRPGRGYWQQRAVGVDVEPDPLPDVEPGDEIEWVGDGSMPAIAPMSTKTPRRRSAAERPDKHQLLVGARGHFDEVRAGREVLYVLPRKKNLVDIFVTPATLERALKVASELFLFLEDRGQRVVLAPAGRGYVRKELNIREGVKPRYEYGEYERGRWQPATPTIILVGDVAIGITIYETIEEVDSVWRGGKPVRYTAPPPLPTPKRGRALLLPQEHVSKHWFPTGRLGVHAYAAEHIEWEQTWIEKTPGELTSMFDAIAKTFEGAVAKITRLLEEKRIEQERREKEHELQRQRWRREEEERRRKEEEAARVKRIQDDVAVWRLARDIRAFVAEAKQMVTDANCQITKGGPLEEWLDWATAYAETVDPLAQLRADLRRVVAEREAKAAADPATSDPTAASTAATSAPSPSTTK